MTRVTLILAFVSASVVLAQKAEISGLILDPSALKVSGAEITVRNEQTGGKRITKTNDSGFYAVFSLNPGDYRISVRAAGFEAIVRDGIRLNVGENARLDFTLRIGDSHSEVTVHGGPPLLNTEDASVGTVIDRDIIDQMPLNGRGIQSLVALTPGVVVVPVVDSSRGQFAVNGQRGDANYFTVDGVSANFGAGNALVFHGPIDGRRSTLGQAGGGMLPANNFLGTFSNLVSPDALQEFKIQTSTFAPEFGRAPGAQIALVTRSGGNHYFGSLSEYLRNDKSDASDWFANQRAEARHPLRLNNFGGTLGGPVRIPQLYNGHDRTFFFLSAEALIVAQPQPASVFPVPTLQARRNAPPSIAALLNAFPLPNQPANPSDTPGFGQSVNSFSLRHEQRTYSVRVDRSFSDRVTMFARYNQAPSWRFEPVASAIASSLEEYKVGTESLTLGLTHTLSPVMVNEIRVNAGLQSAGADSRISPIAGAVRPADSLIFPAGYSSSDAVFSLLIFPPTSGFMVGFFSQDEARQLQFVDNLSYSKGTHQFKGGVDYRWFSPIQTQPRSLTAAILPSLYISPGIYSDSFGISLFIPPESHAAYVLGAFSAYLQDTWRASKKFTVTYGARWEVDSAPRVSAGRARMLAGASSLGEISSAHLVPDGKPFYPTTWTNLAPRLGIGWQATKGTVMRSGAGWFYGLAQSGFEDSGFLFPFRSSVYVNQRLGSIATGSSSTLSPLPDPIVRAVAPRYKLPLTYEWNVTIEQSIGRQTISAGYVGALGRRLVSYRVGPTNVPAYPSVELLGNDASSSFHSLQLQVHRRLSSWARLLVSYTWAHSIDNLSNDAPGADETISAPQPFPSSLRRGPSDFDIRHGLNGSAMIDLPSPRTGVRSILFRNWSASSIFFARSAFPTDVLGVSRFSRPNLVSGGQLYLYGPQYPGGKRYNDAAFSDTPPGVEGDLGRNALRGFGAWQIDFALHRTFRLFDRASLQFRAEAFNVLNHPNFSNPSDPGDPGKLTLAHNSGFGTSTGMLATGLSSTGVPGELNPLFQIGGPRSMQFALRLRF